MQLLFCRALELGPRMSVLMKAKEIALEHLQRAVWEKVESLAQLQNREKEAKVQLPVKLLDCTIQADNLLLTDYISCNVLIIWCC
jgi:hypothetical protein